MEKKQKTEEELEKEKKVRSGCFLIFILTIVIACIVQMCSKSDDNEKQPENVVSNESAIKEWIHEKDIDLNTGDTIYTATLIAEGPYLSGYTRTTPNAFLSISKCKDKTRVVVVISIGEFIEKDKIGIFFGGTKPDLECKYILEDHQKVVLDIPNTTALLKKINMKTFMTLELPIQKQDYKVPFSFIFGENSLKYE